MRKMTRRELLAAGSGLAVFAALGIDVRSALAGKEEAEAAVKAFAGDATIDEGRITLETPEIAENGNTVPIGVEVESPMTEDDYVEQVAIFAEDNPNPEVVTFNFTPASGIAAAKTRIRLAKTQNVVAVAKMSDGSVHMVKNEVKVTIGGCGG